MVERITREGDRNIYQPKIHAERISELYKVKLITGLPMTVLVDEAIRQYVEKFKGTDEWEKLTELQDEALDKEFEYRREMEEEDRWRDIDPWEDGTMYGF